MGYLKSFSAIAAVALAVAATSGAAFAGNPHNPGASPGNSGSAPGQVKQDQPAPAADPAQQPPQTGKATAPGQAKKTEPTATATPSSHGAAKSQAAKPAQSQGAAPKTSSTPAPVTHSNDSAVDHTKQYGNGQTALQVAKKAVPGVTASDLTEPGNSGHHKITICHNGHLISVDVHALGAHSKHLDGSDVIPATSATQCGSSVQSGPPLTHGAPLVACPGTTATTTVASVFNALGRLLVNGKAGLHGQHKGLTVQSSSTTVVTAGSCSSTQSGGTAGAAAAGGTIVIGATSGGGGTQAAGAGATGGVAGASSPTGGFAPTAGGGQGGVLGAHAALTKPAKGQGGVLGATAALRKVVTKGHLPFTGFPLWLAALVALGLIGGGAALTMRGRERARV